VWGGAREGGRVWGKLDWREGGERGGEEGEGRWGGRGKRWCRRGRVGRVVGGNEKGGRREGG